MEGLAPAPSGVRVALTIEGGGGGGRECGCTGSCRRSWLGLVLDRVRRGISRGIKRVLRLGGRRDAKALDAASVR